MMRSLLFAAACLITLTPVSGADLTAGRNTAARCMACHGYAGISANDEWPNLAGQKTGYLVKQLRDFRDGTRTDPVMSPMAEGLTNEEMENIAAWYNSLTTH